MADAQRCLACGAGHPAIARFCSTCGVRLHAHAQSTGAPQLTRERRQITVMFCDLVGSTRLSLELDAEDFSDTISAYRDVCARIVRHWHGHVSRYVGDGVLVYFGYPRAGENDAYRAVAAAWELAHAMRPLRCPPATGKAGRLQVRIGLHTGLAIVGDVVGSDSLEVDGALGAVPNIAARLQALAQPGEVVISDDTAGLLPASVSLHALERGTERSDYGTVRALVVTAMPQALSAGRAMSGAALIGRQQVLNCLAASLRAPPGGGALLVCGEPGVGKSRLVHELVHALQQDDDGQPRVWLRVGCSAYERLSPLHPFREWIDSLPAPAASTRDDEGVAPTPYDRRRSVFGALRSVLMDRAPRAGLVIEDMHWADSTTLEFVAELLSTCVPENLMLMMTSRQPPHEVLQATGRVQVETLGRLSPGDAAALARALAAASRALSAFELAEIVERADGVPLHIEEFVHAIGRNSAGPDRIPITLRDSLMSVLDSLSAGRTVALCASVFGRRFDLASLQALLPLQGDEIELAVLALTHAQVLVQHGVGSQTAFEFRHALLRDTAYYTLLKSEREHLHRRVAELADAGVLPIKDSMPELLATHHSLGGNHARAVEYWLRAQELAMQRSANAEALAHIRCGLADCRSLAATQAAQAAGLELGLLRQLVRPLIAVSGWSTPEIEEVYTRGLQLCGETGSEDAAYELEFGRYNMHLLRSELHTADAMADRLLANARQVGEPGQRDTLLLIALRCKALSAFYAGAHAQARVYLEEVLALYDPRRHGGHAFRFGVEPAMLAHAYLAWMDAVDGNVGQSRHHMAAALERGRAEGHVFSVCYALCFAASCAQLSGDVGGAEAYAQEASRVGNRQNFQYWIAWADAVRGWALGQIDPSGGIAQIDEARRNYLATGSSLVAPYFDALALGLEQAFGVGDPQLRERQLYAHAERTGVWFWKSALRRDLAQAYRQDFSMPMHALDAQELTLPLASLQALTHLATDQEQPNLGMVQGEHPLTAQPGLQ